MRKCKTSWNTVPATGQRNHNVVILFKNKKAKFSSGLSSVEQRTLDQVRICPPERKSPFLLEVEHPPGWRESPGYSRGCGLNAF